MPIRFDLIVTADQASHSAEFHLHDAQGVQLAYRKTALSDISTSHQRGLFDLRNFLRLYVEGGKESAAAAEVGVCIAEEVLGQAIFEKLWASKSQRTLRIQLPGAGDADNQLAAALARIPWEIARPSRDADTLGERNLIVRVVHDMTAPASSPIESTSDDPLRVLFVFAESRGSRPLGARKERRQLLHLFEKEIYPHHRIVAHFLTHGVTRKRLAAQIQENGGYHVVHWSGHGHMNLLELCLPGGAADLLSGQELLDLFTAAGGFLPRLFFLSACHSGDILRVRDWGEFLAVARGSQPDERKIDNKDLDLEERPGYTGTAHALLQGGVPSVVAMRYAVGDDYARDMAVEFYRALLAHAQPKSVAAALTLARQAIHDESLHDAARYSVCDHATPVLYGEEHPALTLAKGRGPHLNPRNPRLHHIAELTSAEHEYFVGRTWQLVGLGAEFIGSTTDTDIKPVAVITGLGGMGKTALVAEALSLWESRFEWVLLYHAKPNRLEFEATLRDIHMMLMGELKRYRNHVGANPADAIYRDATAEFAGSARRERLTRNLLRAFKDEPVLLVLDNFETNLKPNAEPSVVAGHTLWACQDPAWDYCLARLARELPGSPSRVVITCRRPLAAVAGGIAHSVLLGPLPSAEAALFLRDHPVLSRMVFGSNETEKALAFRLLEASRFHPLLMDRLAKLAADIARRPQLLASLAALERTKDLAQLPVLFAAEPGDSKELDYLNDALTSSLDHLIRDSGTDARRLLLIIAAANQPETLRLVEAVWSGESHEREVLRHLSRLFDKYPQLPPDVQAQLDSLLPEVRVRLDALPPETLAQPSLAPLLSRLVGVGLVTEQRDSPADANPNLACHELVRERILDWMAQHPHERAGMTEGAICLAYAERLEAVFRMQEGSDALYAGSRAVVYYVQAGAWDRLGNFTSRLVTSIKTPRMIEALIPHLQTAAESAPEGAARWSALCCLADALVSAGRSDASLPFFEQAATLTHAAAKADDGESRLAWSHLATIMCNWANALSDVGDLDAARQRQMESAEAERRAGNPAIQVIGSELEALRIDIEQKSVAAALSEVRPRLARVWRFWRIHRAGRDVPDAPDPEFLGRVLVGALDIARQAHIAQRDWAAAVRRVDSILKVRRQLNWPEEDDTGSRMNRANALMEIPGRLDEAKAELEICLARFQDSPADSAKVLSSLASLLNKQKDFVQAITLERRALARRELLPDPGDRAISHNNLANFLEYSRDPSSLAEARSHRLAALIYRLATNAGHALQIAMHNFVISIRRDRVTGSKLAVPNVAALLAEPAFASLNQWLQQRQITSDKMQAAVSQFFEDARRTAVEGK